ncbi:MAG: hypothetical protein U5K00_06330 [Melioribacteraceae bacterium]|nr:hypothetical protein [Melioribacteraceae bacterium]
MKKKSNKENDLLQKLENGFADFYGDTKHCKTFLSPTSIILLGDHTQYNDGIMITTTLDSYIGFSIRKAENNFSIAVDDKKYSAEKLSELKIESDDFIIKGLANVIDKLVREEVEVKGFECYINLGTSKVFGLGNFASMNVGFLKSIQSVNNLKWTNGEIVNFAVESDRELYGIVVSKPLYHSVMRQRVDTLLYYDLRSDYRKFFTIDPKYKITICNSDVPKENFSERCRERVQECEVGVKGLRLYIWGIKNLRDVEEKFLERHIHMLPKRLYMKCLYNIKQRKIVEEAYKDLRNKKFEEFGKKLSLTHKLLSEDYDISSEIMDMLVKYADESQVSQGSKMISCSYHDSTMNIVKQKDIDKFTDYILKNYSSSNGSELEITSYSITEGVREIKKSEKSHA